MCFNSKTILSSENSTSVFLNLYSNIYVLTESPKVETKTSIPSKLIIIEGPYIFDIRIDFLNPLRHLVFQNSEVGFSVKKC